MGLIDNADIRRLMQDPGLMDEIAKAVIDDPKTMDSLADDIADELSDELEDDPGLKKRIVDAAMSNPEFKQKIVRKLVEDLG